MQQIEVASSAFDAHCGFLPLRQRCTLNELAVTFSTDPMIPRARNVHILCLVCEILLAEPLCVGNLAIWVATFATGSDQIIIDASPYSDVG